MITDGWLARAGELIAIRSTADRPDELRRAVEFVVEEVGDGFVVRRFESGGKPSALLHLAGIDGPFRVVLNAHVDVVPGEDRQFTAVREGDRLYGRGTQDMKTAALVLAGVFRDVAASLPYPVGLQIVADEEIGGMDGTAHQIAEGVRAGFVLIGEQSGLRVVHESKGLAHVRVTATGRAGHAAYPWLGRNALVSLIAAVDRVLRRYPVPATEEWTTTVNLARIETPDRAINQVPASATAWLDIRFPPEDDSFAGRRPAEIAAHLGDLAGHGIHVHVDALGAPHRADPAGAEVLALQAAAREAGFTGELLRKHGAADGRHYSAYGMPAVIFGPGGDGQHGPEEYVDLTTLAPYRDAVTAFLRSVRP
ncbi:MAG: M20/M25/M40 family metallo-hydrolase [Actinoplanes sp.]